jgi:DNA-binding transcriptional ArsR family regulator
MNVFAVLAEPVRMRIVEVLATGEHSSTNVADVLHREFGVSHSAVSRHLRVLARAGFAAVRVEGPYRLYRLDAEALEQIDRAVDSLHDLWDARYGWPYLADPLASSSGPRTASARPHRGRGRRGRSSPPVVVEITESNDPWQWMGD